MLAHEQSSSGSVRSGALSIQFESSLGQVPVEPFLQAFGAPEPEFGEYVLEQITKQFGQNRERLAAALSFVAR